MTPPFRFPSVLSPTENAPAVIQTPLGFLNINVDIDGQSLPPGESYESENGDRVKRYLQDDVRIDLFIGRTTQKLRDGFDIDECFVALWRIHALKATRVMHLRAEWDADARTEDGGYNSGEHLTALTWDAPGIQVSIGTYDEETLPAIFEDPIYWPRAIREDQGLEIPVPPLLAGTDLLLHFLVAWKTGEVDEYARSTWFAVDAMLHRGTA